MKVGALRRDTRCRQRAAARRRRFRTCDAVPVPDAAQSSRRWHLVQAVQAEDVGSAQWPHRWRLCGPWGWASEELPSTQLNLFVIKPMIRSQVPEITPLTSQQLKGVLLRRAGSTLFHGDPALQPTMVTPALSCRSASALRPEPKLCPGALRLFLGRSPQCLDAGLMLHRRRF